MRVEYAQVRGGGGVVILLTRQKCSELSPLGTGVYPARLILWSCWLIFIVKSSWFSSFLRLFLTVPYFSMRNSAPLRYIIIRKFQATFNYFFAEANLLPRVQSQTEKDSDCDCASLHAALEYADNEFNYSLVAFCVRNNVSRSGGGISGFGRESAGSQRFLWAMEILLFTPSQSPGPV